MSKLASSPAEMASPDRTATASKRQRSNTPSFPRLPLFSAIGLIVFALAATTFGRITDIGTVRVADWRPVEMRDIVFADAEVGRVTVTDAFTGETVGLIEAGEDNFIRGTLRGLSRERKRRGIAQDSAYRLIAWDSGHLTLSDIETGQRIYLNAFGPTNAGAFARFLIRESGPREHASRETAP